MTFSQLGFEIALPIRTITIDAALIMSAVTQVSTLTCPDGGAAHTTEMPTESCQFFWECPACESVLRPKDGDCCVFCSYGSVPCPPVQQDRSSCS
jgi:hypothetical protein